MKRLLSLFDHTGRWSQPWYDAGWDVFEVDLKNRFPIDINSVQSCEEVLEEWGDFDAVLAAIPCTHWAASGAQYWKAKDEDGRTREAEELVFQTRRLINLFEPTDPEYIEENGHLMWVIENPIGRFGRMFPELGKPKYFDPCDYAGILKPSQGVLTRLEAIRAKNGVDVTRDEVAFVVQHEAYTKRTCLWGNFVMPPPQRIEPVRLCKQGSFTQRLGGKSERTKDLRSVTPAGFSLALFESNREPLMVAEVAV